ncbi:flavin reductase family protein [Virgibacillus byunsanensis]|uniref:Flavin reductase family protein n=1 Tax=Virgibacillus byunsanensis TaxID=570945 RepID=A0ABW3LQ19_9BACI
MEISSKDCNPKDLYKLMTGMIVPRPIAFVSTKSVYGVHNVAPFSFFSAVTSDPPIIMFSLGEHKGEKKDTLVNIEHHKEFTINVVTEDIAQAMHESAADFAPDVSEFEEIGLTPIPAAKIDCMSVKESPIHMECTLEKVIGVGANYMVLGRVVHFRIDDKLYMEPYKINIAELKPVGRLAGNMYSETKNLYKLDRHVDKRKLR